MSRRAEVFFYGLFMDQDLLRSRGLRPENVELASVDGMALHIGQRASLVSTAGARVHGVVMSLSLAELAKLYSEPSVQAYRPEAVLARLESGGLIAALCYNLPEPLPPNERNPEYAAKLRTLGQKLGLPEKYLRSIQ